MTTIEEIPDLEEEEESEDEELDDFRDETAEETKARAETEVFLSPQDQGFIDTLVSKILVVVDELSGHPLYEYQRPLAARMIESLILNDGATITALVSRQGGKSETVANVVASCMIMFPKLAPIFPEQFSKYKDGMWVGAFAPVEDQADTLFGRIVSRLTSEQATAFMQDPEIDDLADGRGKLLRLKNSGSFVRRQTAHPRAIIEGRTYHLILIDEAQGAIESVVNRSIFPMGSATNATKVLTGTPTYNKNVFYKTIQQNKRQQTRRGARPNHFEADWKMCAKSNPNYGKFVRREILRIGEDSDEFKISYRIMWLLDQGQFVTGERLDDLGDKTMQVVHSWFKTPVVVGIDPARKKDSTVITVVWIGWDNPDEFGFYDHRVLNWLDLTGMEWEEQYFRIVEFLSNYHVMAIGVDVGGIGDVVVGRLKVLLPQNGIHAEIFPLGSQRPEQSQRWKHLMALIQRGKISWPAHAKSRRLRTYRRFRAQMEDLEQKFDGPYMMAMAPNETDAHDDYPDSLSLACILTNDMTLPEVEVSSNPFFN